MSEVRVVRKVAVTYIDGQEASSAADHIRERLTKDNDAKVGPMNARALVLALTDDRGTLVGGLIGETFWNTLHIELLWIADEHRGCGNGRRLLEAAEREGRERGTDIAYLSTLSFQAPEFYEQLGYRRFGDLPDSPKGASRYWYYKRIGNDAA